MRALSVVATLLIGVCSAVGAERPVAPLFETRASLSARSSIDRAVFAKLRGLDIQPANVCSDSVFVRRVYLDVIGTLPTAQEAAQFLMDRNPHKRAALIKELLQRDEFADYWAMKWGDLLRIKAEFPINLWPNAVQAYHRWIRTSIRDNMSYDQFVREIITASGSNFREPQVNFYRSLQSKEPKAIAQAVALTFMGVRADKWPEERLDNMAVFFSRVGYKSTAEWKEEIVYFDFQKAAAAGATTARLPDGTTVQLAPDQDPREVFANWLIAPDNPWFVRSFVNRIWYWLMGRGVIHDPDDIRPDNPAANPKLLAALEREFIAAKYDPKEMFRIILNSKTYQLSSIRRSDHPQAEAHFAFYPLRRLDAEVLIDALCQITGTTEEYSSPIPEPFTFIPEDQRSISLADGSITSPFLEMFGRPPRDTGLESERNNLPSAAQRLHVLNSTHVQSKIERGPKLRKLVMNSRNPRKTISTVYLTVLSRLPTEEELRAVQQYVKSGNVSGREAMVDIVWALINSVEFLYRH